VDQGAYAIQLIVGLGNPGSEYAATRHNVGAWLVESLCQQNRLQLKTESKFNARITEWLLDGKTYKILIPNTFMNHCGQTVGAIAQYYQIPPEAIFVAHDELDLKPGVVQFKISGGHAGHNGLRDIINHLQSRNFRRLRLGIGHPGNKDEVSDYVLHKPSKAEEQKIRKCIEESINGLPHILMGDWQSAMRYLHNLTN